MALVAGVHMEMTAHAKDDLSKTSSSRWKPHLAKGRAECRASIVSATRSRSKPDDQIELNFAPGMGSRAGAILWISSWRSIEFHRKPNGLNMFM